MRKKENDFKKEIEILKNPLIHTPELCRILGLSSRGNFRDKLNETAGARFTDPQKKEITKQLKKLSKQLSGL